MLTKLIMCTMIGLELCNGMTGVRPVLPHTYKSHVHNIKSNTGIIMLGDSRFVGIDNAVEQGDNVFFVAKVGEGYDWFVDTAIDKINDIMNCNTDIEDWVIVTGLGVNDIKNYELYQDKYDELLESDWSDVTLYYVSVNPVDESKCSTVTNKKIQKFNKTFSQEDTYIDTYSYVYDNMGDTRDGLHYGETLNKKLYSLIMDGIDL